MSEKTRFLFRKGAVDVICYLGDKDAAGYYEIYKQGFVVSRQTFSDLLKTLVEKGVLERMVIDAHPPRVNYRLTEKGIQIQMLIEAILEEL